MNLTVTELSESLNSAYDDFLQSCDRRLIYYTRAYRKFLHACLGDVTSNYFIVTTEHKIVGVLPTFTKLGPLGPVVNSLPYYGSHGDVMVSHDEPEKVTSLLYEYFTDYCFRIGAISSTIISNPYAQANCIAEPRSDFLDQRVGQVTELPSAQPEEQVLSFIMSNCHSKTRNMIRKAVKYEFDLAIDNSAQAVNMLYQLHVDNMKAIGGKHKTLEAFHAITTCFEPGKEFNIYTASKDDDVAAMLLLLYYGETVEYFTPVINQGYRSEQPLSALIFEAMKDASMNGFKYWNWGGTWLTQDGVYRFKKRWGAIDHYYNYYTKVYGGLADIKKESAKSLLNYYPNFFVVPFSILE